MLKKIFLSALFLSLPLNSLQAEEIDSKVKGIEDLYSHLGGYSASFTQWTHFKGREATVIQQGNLKFDKNGRVKISNRRPSTDEQFVSIPANGKVVGISELSKKEKKRANEPLAVLASLKDLSGNYSIEELDRKTHFYPKNETCLRLVPQKKASDYEGLKACFLSDSELADLSIGYNGGDVNYFQFYNILMGSSAH
jgi:outer membrane lipoprotein-sorting protein